MRCFGRRSWRRGTGRERFVSAISSPEMRCLCTIRTFGSPIPTHYSAFRIDDRETGQPVNIGNVCRDITERKRAEAKARENDRRYREMQMELAHAHRVA